MEAAAKIAISLRLCLEPHLKQENIFCPLPHMVRGLWNHLGIVSSRIVNKTIPNMLVKLKLVRGVKLKWSLWHGKMTPTMCQFWDLI